MSINNNKLSLAIRLGLLAVMTGASLGNAQIALAQESVKCDGQGCGDGQETLVRIRTEGERQPRTNGDSAAALQDNRRVDIALPPSPGQEGKKVAQATGRFAVNLPDGGMLWASEDPAMVVPTLNVSTGTSAPVTADGKLAKPLTFSMYSNYGKFIDRYELSVYHGTDGDLVSPVAVLRPEQGRLKQAVWDGSMGAGERLRAGDELIYVLRAYDAEGHVDETQIRRVALLRPEEYERSLSQLRQDAQGTEWATLTSEQLQDKQTEGALFGTSSLRQQNIPLYGSRVRVFGQDIPEGYQITIDGEAYPIDLERKFVAELMLPIGSHTLDVSVNQGTESIARIPMNMDVTGKYMYLVALADVTVSENSVSGSVQAAQLGDGYDDIITEGRLAFYLKGKVQGKYLITAQADTKERELEHLFDGFLDEYPTDVFRRLDPDAYYPVYGDDSTTYRDVDTMGRLYVRVDWRQNQALWGNYDTGLTGTELSQYSRSLYGGALAWRSQATTKFGDPSSQWRVFGSQAQTSLGHTEFLGTGGSVYYLKHTDLLPGSDKIVLELRDRTTGRAESQIPLASGVDYEIDYLQGRIILSRPLSQYSQTNLPSIIRDTPLDGLQYRLITDYEYIPDGFDADQNTIGVRGKQWIGDHIGIGATYVDENRAGDDYNLAGGDLTLQAGRGTYLKMEYAQTDSTQAPVFYSDNGGLSFNQINPSVATAREGNAKSVEARANFRELGWTARDWTIGGWWRELDSGYSTAYRDAVDPITEQGVEFNGQVTDTFRLAGRASELEQGAESLKQVQLLGDWDITPNDQLVGEVRSVRETRTTGQADGLLGALQYTRRINDTLDLYGTAQVTLDDDDGRYADNDAYTLGGKYLFGNASTIGASHTWGDRGDGTSVDINWQRTAEHSLYGRYTWSTDTTERLFDNRGSNADPAGLTLGQRWRLSNQVSLYNESQQLKEGNDTGVSHTYGMDFMLGKGWNMGFTLQNGELNAMSGEVERNAVSVSGGFRSPDTEWSSHLEYRKDTGAERREQWATTNRLMHKINQSWRIAARINYSDTEDEYNPAASARFTEANLGFAWRPWDSERWALLGKYTYLYDLSSLGQENAVSEVDQRSQIIAFEGIYKHDDNWEFAGKLARREGEVRAGRGTGQWFDSRADFAAIQVRYHLRFQWDALVEYRWLHTNADGSSRQGWLAGVDRRLSENFRVGVGYNFTDFSNDLTQQDYDHKGWFLNFVGTY